MKLLVLVIGSLLLTLPGLALAQECTPAGNEDVLFCDAFDSPSLDHTDIFREVNIDGVSRYAAHSGAWNSQQFVHGCEYQYYTLYGVDYSVAGPENYLAPGHQSNFVLNGSDTLSLVLRNEPGTPGYIPGWMGGPPGGSCWMNWSVGSGLPQSGSYFQESFNYTSGWLQTAPQFKYGKFEIRARIPNQGRVAWPAFWLFGGTSHDGGAASHGENATEIDIFEFTLYAAHHFTRNVHSYFTSNKWFSLYGDPANDLSLETCNPWSPTCNYHLDNPNNSMVVHDGYAENLSVNVEQWHTYTLEWTPQVLRWWLDGQPIGPEKRDRIPTNFMELIINQALPDWLSNGINNGIVDGDNTNLTLPSNFEIDYVKVSAIEEKHFTWEWGNGGSDQIDLWFINADDRHVAGDFDGDQLAELLSVNPTSGYAHLMEYNPITLDRTNPTWIYTNAYWNSPWLNIGSGSIDQWAIGAFDRFISGDFVPDPAGKDEVLAINPDGGFVHLMEFNGTSWSTPFSNSGSGQLDTWFVNSDDHYVVGNFDGLPGDELLAINEASGHAHLLKFDGSVWTTIWWTDSGQIQTWFFHDEDDFVAGDFDNDGVADLFAANANTLWAGLFSYDTANSTFVIKWSNGGSGQIAGWNQNSPDVFVGGSFDGEPGDDLLAYNPGNGWSKLLNYEAGGGFQEIWHNLGFGRLHDPYHMFAGQFAPGGKEQLLSINLGRWAYLQRYRPPSQVFDFGTGIEGVFRKASWNFVGVALGGSIDFSVEGIEFSVPTISGEQIDTVAANLASAINSDLVLSSLGVTASSSGGVLNVNGELSDVMVNDPGLSVAVPMLAPWIQVFLLIALAGTGSLLLRSRSRRGQPEF